MGCRSKGGPPRPPSPLPHRRHPSAFGHGRSWLAMAGHGHGLHGRPALPHYTRLNSFMIRTGHQVMMYIDSTGHRAILHGRHRGHRTRTHGCGIHGRPAPIALAQCALCTACMINNIASDPRQAARTPTPGTGARTKSKSTLYQITPRILAPDRL